MSLTQSQLAQTLNVSQVAVSLAFREGHNRLSGDTRQRILSAAKELGYRPNRLASGLRGGRTSSIGIIWAFADPWAGDAVIALDLLNRLQHHGLAVYQSQHSASKAVMLRQLDDLIARRADALIIQAIPSQLRDPDILERLESFDTVIAVCRENIRDFPHDLLIHDRNRAISEVVDHLVAAGRKRIAMATSIAQESNPPKFKAFVDRLHHHGLADHDHLLINLDTPSDPSLHGQLHADAMQKLFPADQPMPVDAIFCFNDTGALYVMRELFDRGLRVPEDVAVVGFNNIEPGRVWNPPLATGDRMAGEVSAGLDQMLKARLDDPDLEPQRKTVHMRFVRRESAGNVPSRSHVSLSPSNLEDFSCAV